MRKIKHIAIFGGAEAADGSILYQEVFNVAQTLAEHDYTIVNGGGPGVMLAATQGAESVGGKTLSVTFDPKNAPGFEGRYVKNQTDKEIKTHNYIERMFTLMEQSDCYVIFNGGTGTISEFGTAWCLARLYYGHHKPFILYGNFWHDVIAAFYKNMMMRANDDKVFEITNSPEEVLRAINLFNKEREEVKLKYPKSKVDKKYTR
ncbi:hypothetical protein GYA49_00140 [Candidatus Beckwithbacteria bacterium]|nr:hypothetical protein [Candidatus Beckwithbacteria bacterium]